MTKTEKLTNDLYEINDLIAEQEEIVRASSIELEGLFNESILGGNGILLEDLITFSENVNYFSKALQTALSTIEELSEKQQNIITAIEDLVYIDELYDKVTKKIISKKDEDYISLLQVYDKNDEEDIVCFGFSEDAIENLIELKKGEVFMQ